MDHEVKWIKVGSFVLSGDELNDVLSEENGKVAKNRLRYADCLAEQLSIQWPGRYVAAGQRTRDESNILKLLFKKSCYQSGCEKKWTIACNKDSYSTGEVKFTVEVNDRECFCLHRPTPRPLSGK